MKHYLVSIPEAMEILGVSRYYIDKAVDEGTFRNKQIGNRIYLVRQDVLDFVKLEA